MSYNNAMDTSKGKGSRYICEPAKAMGMKQDSKLKKVNMMGEVKPKMNALPAGVIPALTIK